MTSHGRFLVVALCLAATGGYLRLLAATDREPSAKSLSALPYAIGAWEGREDAPLDAETQKVLQADGYVLRTYISRAAAPMTVFVAYYATQRSGHTMHSPLNCLPGTGWQWIDRQREQLSVDGGRELDVNRNLAERDGRKVLMYYWYQSRGRTIASEYQNKVLLVRDALMLHRSDAALVRITADGGGDNIGAAQAARSFIRDFYPSLTRYFPE